MAICYIKLTNYGPFCYDMYVSSKKGPNPLLCKNPWYTSDPNASKTSIFLELKATIASEKVLRVVFQTIKFKLITTSYIWSIMSKIVMLLSWDWVLSNLHSLNWKLVQSNICKPTLNDNLYITCLANNWGILLQWSSVLLWCFCHLGMSSWYIVTLPH